MINKKLRLVKIKTYLLVCSGAPYLSALAGSLAFCLGYSALRFQAVPYSFQVRPMLSVLLPYAFWAIPFSVACAPWPRQGEPAGRSSLLSNTKQRYAFPIYLPNFYRDFFGKNESFLLRVLYNFGNPFAFVFSPLSTGKGWGKADRPMVRLLFYFSTNWRA